jgi:TonB family protein
MKPHIPIPCSEDWNNMKIGQIGRHCGVCDKTVVDFTQKSRHEILSYLIENRNQEVCGHVRMSQLDFRHQDTLIVIRDLEKKHRNTNLSYYLLSMATLSLMACESNPKLPASKSKIEEVKLGRKSGSDTICQQADEKQVNNVGKIETKRGEEIQFVEGTVDGGMIIEPTILGGAMELEVKTPEPVLLGELELDPKPRMIVEQMPEFPGGTEALIQFIERELNYPKWEKRRNIQGTVYATFVINQLGEITEPKILKSVEGSKNMDQAVLDVLKKMPRWQPGKDHGQTVPVQFNLPFKFVR